MYMYIAGLVVVRQTMMMLRKEIHPRRSWSQTMDCLGSSRLRPTHSRWCGRECPFTGASSSFLSSTYAPPSPPPSPLLLSLLLLLLHHHHHHCLLFSFIRVKWSSTMSRLKPNNPRQDGVSISSREMSWSVSRPGSHIHVHLCREHYLLLTEIIVFIIPAVLLT